MKNLTTFLFAIVISFASFSQDLDYFLPDSVTYDPKVPVPAGIIHHQVGEWHVTHDRLVNYMQALAAAVPGRLKLETMGFTYERRPQVLLIITSPANHARLEEIRQQHLLLSDPARSASVNIDDMPIVVWIGQSIHGNEPSGANASLLSVYYLAAAQGKQIEELLQNTVILFDPSFNPDGLQRFSTWANQHRSKNLVSDPSSREFNEVWPGGRYNHYWFDLNRDWLPAVHVESRNRLEWFHKWKPNILTDHHEQGSNATFFFQPGVPSRVNPLTPKMNQQLTAKLANYHAAYLDRIGSLYFTKEAYDDFYYGKGSTYPDINGAIGILFEQASSRGHLQQTSNGLLSFPFTIRNQFVTTLSTLEGARQLRKDFLAWQREFYQTVLKESVTDPVKAYVFGGGSDEAVMDEFITILKRHQVQVHSFNNEIAVAGKKYRPSDSYLVTLNQPQAKLVKTIFSKTHQYEDSLFYDITTWTMPLAMGLNADELSAPQLNQAGPMKPYTPVEKTSNALMKSEYAYLLDWKSFESPGALYQLLNKGIKTRTATNVFTISINGTETSFPRGTVLIPVGMQSMNSGDLHAYLGELNKKYRVRIIPVHSGGAVSGSDLGSSNFIPLTKPSIALITGQGVNALEAGEVWHLLDQRMNIPATHLDMSVFNRADVDNYNTLIMVGGNYNEMNKEKLKKWVEDGGTLILIGDAIPWAARNEISAVQFKKSQAKAEENKSFSYADRPQLEGAQQLRGAIFKAEMDLTHPLAFGYDKNEVSFFKANRVFMEKSKNPYATPFYYQSKPLQSGWVSRENLEMVKNSAAVVVNSVGSGKVINIAENPNFRAFWLGGTKVFMNAIFFGRVITAASAR